MQLKKTVRFYLRKKSPLVDYQPHGDGQVGKIVYDQGYSLVLMFVRGDGVSSDFMSVLFTVALILSRGMIHHIIITIIIYKFT